MKGFVWGVVAVAGLAWTGLGWLLYSLAGSGGATVVGLTRWLDLEPSSTQWIADGLSMAGDIAQWLVVLLWLIGAVGLALVGWLGSAALNGANVAVSRYQKPARGDEASVVDGEVRDKKVS